MLFVASIALGASALTASSANAAPPQVWTQASATAQPTSPVGTLTLDDGRTVEVPRAYLEPGAPKWIEYPASQGRITTLAVGGVCTKPLCGKITNKGSVSMTVGTDYSSNGGLQQGARKKVIAPGETAGYPYDWDAVWVPPGYCGTFYTGAGYYFRSTNSRVGMATGWWHQIDDNGAHAIICQGSCA